MKQREITWRSSWGCWDKLSWGEFQICVEPSLAVTDLVLGGYRIDGIAHRHTCVLRNLVGRPPRTAQKQARFAGLGEGSQSSAARSRWGEAVVGCRRQSALQTRLSPLSLASQCSAAHDPVRKEKHQASVKRDFLHHKQICRLIPSQWHEGKGIRIAIFHADTMLMLYYI